MSPSTASPSPAHLPTCPCGSGAPEDSCCHPVLMGAAAVTAEALMRSRFTAFARRHVDHLLRSWHSATRPARDELAGSLDPDRRWTRLVIHETEGGGAADSEGIVEFTAIAREADGSKARLRERSRFVREGGRWVYIDGDVSA